MSLKSYGVINLCSSGIEGLVLNIHSRLRSVPYLHFFYLNQLASIRVQVLLIKFVSPDDEHEVLETCKEL